MLCAEGWEVESHRCIKLTPPADELDLLRKEDLPAPVELTLEGMP